MVPSTFGSRKTPFESENRGPNPIWLLPINTNIVSQKSRNQIVQSIYDDNNKAPKENPIVLPEICEAIHQGIRKINFFKDRGTQDGGPPERQPHSNRKSAILPDPRGFQGI